MGDAEIHYERTEDGLTLLLQEARATPVVELQIAAQVGAADEGPGERGLAHFLEHMLFRKTPTRDVDEIAGAIEGAGGWVNAFTSFDLTVYHATVPTDGLPLATEILIDMARNALFRTEDVAQEIEVVLEEIGRAEDSAACVAGDALFATCFHDHPYGAPILGNRRNIEGTTPELVRSFYERWYGVDNLVVVAVGDFDTGRLAAQLRRAFQGAPPRGARRTRPREAPQRAPRAAALRRPFERARLELAWPGVALRHEDAPLLEVLAFALGGGDSSRLVRRVKEGAGCVDGIDAHCYAPFDRGLLGISADLDVDRLPEATTAVVREVERLRREVLSEGELETARENLLAAECFDRESVSGLARKLLSFEVLGGDYRLEGRYRDAIRSASTSSLRGIAERYLRPETLCAAAVLPEGAANGIDETAITRAAEAGVAAAQRLFRTPRRRTATAPLHSYELPCRAVLHVEPRPGVPVLALRGVLLGGSLFETEHNAGLTQFLSSVWLRGTRNRSAAGLARAIESIAADLGGFAGRSTTGLALEVPSRHGDAALDLFAEILLEPALEANEIERERRETLAAIVRREDLPAARVFDLFAATHWRRHPYRLPQSGSADSVARFAAAPLRRHHEALVRGGNLVLGAAGDVDPERLAAALALRLASLEPSDTGLPLPDGEAPPDAPRSAELHKEGTQCHVVVGFRGLTVDDPDRHALEVVAQLLGGQGGRLFLELRDRRGLAYAVGASHVEGVAPGYFAVYIACAPAKLEAARTGIRRELEGFLKTPPSAAELERARRYLIGSHLIERQYASRRAAQLALDARLGLGAAAARDYPAAIARVDADAALRVARRVLRLDLATVACIRSHPPGDADEPPPPPL